MRAVVVRNASGDPSTKKEAHPRGGEEKRILLSLCFHSVCLGAAHARSVLPYPERFECQVGGVEREYRSRSVT